MFKITCSGIVFDDNTVTLVRDETSGVLRLPGGPFDGIDGPADYAQRAILKETGYPLKSIRLFKIKQGYDSTGRVNLLHFVFGCKRQDAQTAPPTHELLHLTPDDVIRRAAKDEIKDQLLIHLITDYKQGGMLVRGQEIM